MERAIWICTIIIVLSMSYLIEVSLRKEIRAMNDRLSNQLDQIKDIISNSLNEIEKLLKKDNL
jgi:hypothetical protein